MHKEILSSKEREIIKDFLNGKETNGTFRVLKHRIKSYHPQLHQDLNLIEKALKKF
jgi:hypothetical protein